MTDLAAISGTLSDVKLIKSRSVMQLVVEIAIEQADTALKTLGGVPQPGRERHVAVALLDPKAITSGPSTAAPAAASPTPEPPPQAPEKGRRTSGAASVVQRCATLCTEPRFQQWVEQQFINVAFPLRTLDTAEEREYRTAASVRQLCKIESRRELATNPDARTRWLALLTKYEQAHGLIAEKRSA